MPAHATPPLTISPLGDSALVIRVGERIEEPVRQRIVRIARTLSRDAIDGVLDIVQGFTTVTVHYAPMRVSGASPSALLPYDLVRDAVMARLDAMADDVDGENITDDRTVEIPVCYDGELGPDLEHVARSTGLAVADVIARHSGAIYRVHMLGFMPGFPYLGGLDPLLATPRRTTPRPRVPAGSVGIGGSQTGVYPLATPGGWHLIGRTPELLFDATAAPPTLLRAGDRVRFVPIERADFDQRSGNRG